MKQYTAWRGPRKIKDRAHLSHKFITAVLKAEGTYPIKKIPQQFGIHPETFTKYYEGINKVSMSDERILKMAQFVGIKNEEIFYNVERL